MRTVSAILVLAAVTAASSCGSPSAMPAPPPTASPAPRPRAVLPDGRVVSLEIARTPEQRAQGLMFRSSMPANAGMLFLFDEVSPQSFWMKNCHFPQDMVFMLADGSVTALLENVPPCPHDPCPSYPAGASADTVLELNAGIARAAGVSVGKKVAFAEVPGR
jgi:uncharacterized membrane protein (UPF0127 family)